MTAAAPLDTATLAKELASPDPEARRLAVKRLPLGRDPKLPELLVRALADEDWRVRKEAAAVAPRVEPRLSVLAELAAALGVKDDIGLRNAAVEALVAFGAEAVVPTTSRLDTLDADGRKLAAEVFAGIPDAKSVSALARLLRDVDANVRAAAAEGLGRAGIAGVSERDLAISALTQSLGADDVMTTLATLEALTQLDAKLPWKVFEPFADLPVFRRHAVLAAARSRDEAALMALLFAAGDRVSTVGNDAIVALASWIALEPLAPEVNARAREALVRSSRALERLRVSPERREDRRLAAASLVVLGLVADPADVALLVGATRDEELTDSALAGLELFGEACVVPALAALGESAARPRSLVLGLVARLAKVASPALLKGLRRELAHESPDVLRAAILALGTHGDREDLTRLLPLARHADEQVALAAVTSLRAVAQREPEAARALRRRLDAHGDDALAGCALSVAPDDEDLDFLERALTHRDPRARRVAVEALGAVTAPRTAEAIAFSLADEEREVRLAAVRALGQIGRADPLAALVASSEDVELVITALRALGEADRARGFAAAEPLVTHREPALACAGVEAVDRFGEGAAREDALFEALGHADVEVVKLALTVLAKSPDARVLARLGLALDHEEWEIRKLASDLLGRSKEPAAQALLRARLDREVEPLVRQALARALSVRPPSGFGGG